MALFDLVCVPKQIYNLVHFVCPKFLKNNDQEKKNKKGRDINVSMVLHSKM